MDNPEEFAKSDFSVNINDVLDEFEDEICKMKGKCLDIGCGPADVGRNLILPRLPPDTILVGIDISQNMIDYAQKKNADEKRMIFKKLDITMTNLPAEEIESYDNGISFFCINCNYDQRRCFENIFKMLRPGGNCIIETLVSQPSYPAYLRIADYPQYKPYIKDVSKMFTPLYFDKNPRATVKKMLQEIGFEVLHCSWREKSYIFNDKEEVKTFLVSINPYLNQIPENMKEEFINDIMREYLKCQLVYVNKNENNLEEQNIMIRFSIMILHIRKPDN